MVKSKIYSSKEEQEVKRIKGKHTLAIKVKNKLLTNEELVKDILETEKKRPKKRKLIQKKPREIKKETNEKQTDEPLTLPSMYNYNQNKLKEKQHKIFVLVNKIKSDPEESIHHLKILLLYLKSEDLSIKYTLFNYAAIALCDLFCEIIPDYKLLSFENNPDMKLKKETRMLKEYEEGLLKYYKNYLQTLKKMLEFLKKCKPKDVNEIAKQKLGLISLKCICKHIEINYHFNFAPDLINAVMPFGVHPNEEIRKILINALSEMFKNDKLGEISLSAVNSALQLAKKRDYKLPPDFLKIFLALNIKEVKLEKEKKDAKTLRSERQKLSRNEKKKEKKNRPLEQSLLEASAKENRDKVLYNHTQIVKRIFNIYFWILKKSPTTCLLSAVLEGMSKFSHLINVEFFDDLIALLRNILQERDLNCQEILHCLNTVFTILSGYGKALNIDPYGFYQPFYQILADLPALCENSGNIPLVLTAFENMFAKRKRSLNIDRVLAFIKRLAVASLQTAPRVTAALLAVIRGLMVDHPKSNSLLDPDQDACTSLYRPDIQDPDFCNARDTTILSELNQLRQNKVSVVSLLAQAIRTESAEKLPPQLKKKPIEIYNLLTSLSTK